MPEVRLDNSEGAALLSLEEAAALLRTSLATVHRLRNNDDFPAPMKVGRVVRFSRADLLAWLQSRTVTAPVPLAGV